MTEGVTEECLKIYGKKQKKIQFSIKFHEFEKFFYFTFLNCVETILFLTDFYSIVRKKQTDYD